MTTKNVDRESAIFKMADSLACMAAWQIANDHILSLKHDSEANGFYWQTHSDNKRNETVTIIKNVGGPFAEATLKTFDRLIDIHIRNLKASNQL